MTSGNRLQQIVLTFDGNEIEPRLGEFDDFVSNRRKSRISTDNNFVGHMIEAFFEAQWFIKFLHRTDTNGGWIVMEHS